ncbi:hypothetical protein DFS34DRAFT_617573 [Phlyctochytrium arcticum]|nr:hypothetical protein DFS34DRAFT_617573 [Phlyctochytrium arcticum]
MPPFEPFPALRSWYSPVNQIAVAFRLRERQALQNALQVAQQEIASLVNDAQYRAVRYQNLQRSRLAQMEQARLDALLREQHNLHRLRRDPFLPSPRSPIAGTELPQVTALEPHPQHSSNGPSPGMGTPHLLYGVDPTQLQAHLELIQWQLHAANAAAPGHTSPNAPANVPTPDAYSVPASPHLHIQGQAYGVPSFIPYAQAPAFLEGAHIVEDVEGTEYEESLSQYDEEDDGSVWQEDWDTEDGGE